MVKYAELIVSLERIPADVGKDTIFRYFPFQAIERQI